MSSAADTLNSVRTEVRTITPEVAKVLLGANHENRKLRNHRVKKYASEITNDQWKLSGEPIIISVTGRLLDGQHRLEAVVLADKPIISTIVYGVADDAFTVIDSGMSRTTADPLAARGFAQAAYVAAASRLVIAVEAGLNPSDAETLNLISRDDLLAYAEANRHRIENAISWGQKAHNAIGGNRTSWTSFALLAQPKYPVEFVTFMEGVIHGAGLTGNDPRLALRNWLIRDRGNRAEARIIYLGTMLRVFNDYITNAPRTSVRVWRRGDDWPTLA